MNDTTTPRARGSRRTVWLGAALAVQTVLIPVAVFGQLSARLTGEEYLVRVGPVDPIDPFRGAYVELSYPDLQPSAEERKAFYGRSWEELHERQGRLYVTLEKQDGVMVGSGFVQERPDSGTYLACDDRDWRIRCGIESLFLSQDEAARVQRDINQSGFRGGEEPGTGQPDSGYVARIKVDRWGHASVVDLQKH